LLSVSWVWGAAVSYAATEDVAEEVGLAPTDQPVMRRMVKRLERIILASSSRRIGRSRQSRGIHNKPVDW
jgi:hypothetical protein